MEAACSECGGALPLDEEHAGRSLACPHCGARSRAPGERTLTPQPRRAGAGGEGTTPLVLAIIAVLGITVCNLILAPFGLVLGLLAPIAWKLASDARRSRRIRQLPPDGTIEAAWWTAVIGTALLAFCSAAMVVALVGFGAALYSGLGDR